MVAHIRMLLSKSCLILHQALITRPSNQDEIDLFRMASTVRLFILFLSNSASHGEASRAGLTRRGFSSICMIT